MKAYAVASPLVLLFAVGVVAQEGEKGLGKPIELASGQGPCAVAIGDVNGDGKADIVVANGKAGTVSVFLNKGNGTFAEKTDYPVGKNPGSIALADVNGDKKLDIVVANRGEPNVSVLLGKGDGTFAPKKDFAIGDKTNQPDRLIVADMNGDGKPDIVTANLSQGTMVIGGDDKDPKNWGNLTSVLLGNGKGDFTLKKNLCGAAGYFAIAVGDVNGDKKLDVVGAIATRPLIGVSLQAGGSFAEPRPFECGNGPMAIALADVNGDKKLDVVTANHEDKSFSVLLGDGKGGFAAHKDTKTSGFPNEIAVADLNGDGKPDVIVLCGGDTDTIAVHLGKGDGTFAEARVTELGGNVAGLAVGDVNGDGKLDVVVCDGEKNKVLVFVGDGTGGK
jgi:hypothetical protein